VTLLGVIEHDDAVQQAPMLHAAAPLQFTLQVAPPHDTASAQVSTFRQSMPVVPVAVLVTVLPQEPAAVQATVQSVPPHDTAP